jgi:hypothetical protein
MIWAIENPERGVIEPDEMDFERVLEICMPYLGPLVGVYTDWTPLPAARACSRKRPTNPIPGSSGTSGFLDFPCTSAFDDL